MRLLLFAALLLCALDFIAAAVVGSSIADPTGSLWQDIATAVEEATH